MIPTTRLPVASFRNVVTAVSNACASSVPKPSSKNNTPNSIHPANDSITSERPSARESAA